MNKIDTLDNHLSALEESISALRNLIASTDTSINRASTDWVVATKPIIEASATIVAQASKLPPLSRSLRAPG